MPGACRLTDIHFNPADSCGCPACSHVVSGPAVTGSEDVNCNSLPALRGQSRDTGVHCCCCGPNIWWTMQCSPDVIVNGNGWTRLSDVNICCGGIGYMITASSNVYVNN